MTDKRKKPMVFKNATTIVLNKLIQKRFSNTPIDVLYHIFDYIEDIETETEHYYLTFEGIVVPLYPQILKTLSNRIENPIEIKRAGVSFSRSDKYSTDEYYMFRINKKTIYLETVNSPKQCIYLSTKNSRYYYMKGAWIDLNNYYREYDEENTMVFDVTPLPKFYK
jgi:hypothetical protein